MEFSGISFCRRCNIMQMELQPAVTVSQVTRTLFRHPLHRTPSKRTSISISNRAPMESTPAVAVTQAAVPVPTASPVPSLRSVFPRRSRLWPRWLVTVLLRQRQRRLPSPLPPPSHRFLMRHWAATPTLVIAEAIGPSLRPTASAHRAASVMALMEPLTELTLQVLAAEVGAQT